MSKILNMVKEGKVVRFKYYREQTLYYETECGFEFPVPLHDSGTAIFKNEDKALLFMRWIRKHLELIKQARKEAMQ